MNPSDERIEDVASQPSLAVVLAPLNRDQLQALLLGLAKSTPDLAGRIEARALALQTLSPPETAAPPRAALPPPDLALLQRQLRSTVRAGGSHRHGYDYSAAGEIAGQLSEIAGQAEPYLAAGDGRGALAILDIAIDAVTDGLDELLDEEGEISSLIEELGKLLAEAILTADLSMQEREEWADQIETWEGQAREYGVEEGFQVADYAADQGWEYAPLRRVLEGEVTEQGAWEGARPYCADDLADIRLNVLERQERWEEYLHLAQAEGRTVRRLTALVQLGRIPEAVDGALISLTARSEVLALAQSLEARGAVEEALRIAEHALATFSEPYPTGELAVWTRDLAARSGQTERALAAGLVAVREHPDLANYTAVPPLAGERWPALREELLGMVRRRRSHYPSDEIDIFLHEGLIEDAMAAVDDSPRHVLVERVVAAALPIHTDWVFRACAHQFDRVADAGKSQYYREAVEFLEKARTALQAAGREEEWRAYLSDVIARHSRKYSLRPMLERLR